MREFLLRLLYFLPIPVLIVAANYYVDPGNLFNKDYEKGVAKYMLDGYHVENVRNYDDRILQKHWIAGMSVCPSTIVLGSSRSMMIDRAIFGDEKLCNNSLAGATLEDYLALLEMYEGKECALKRVIIDLEPHLLNDNHGQQRWRSLEIEYNTFVKKLLPQESEQKPVHFDTGTDEMAELVSITYFKESVTQLLKEGVVSYKPTRKPDNEEFTKHADGSISYRQAFRSLSPTEVNKKAANIDMINYSLENYAVLSEKYSRLLVALIDYLQKKNIDIIFFLGPVHPTVFDYYSSHDYYKVVFDSERFYKDLAERHNIPVIGAYDPAINALDESCFYDGLHCKKGPIQSMFEKQSHDDGD